MTDSTDADLKMVRLQFEEYAEATISTRRDMEKCRDYYDGKQLTDAERKTLKKRKQPAIVDNKIKDKVDTLLGIEKQQRTDPKAFPRNQQDDSSAEVATDTLRYIADASLYKLTCRQPASNNLIIEGLCAGQVVVEKQKGRPPKVCMEHIREDRVFYDIRSLKPDFEDKSYCGYFTWMDVDAALELFPNGKEALDQAFGAESGQSEGGADRSMDDKPRYVMLSRGRKRVQVFTHYFKRKGQWNTCTWCKGGFLDPVKVSAYKDEDGNPDCCIEIQALYRDSDGNPYGVVSRFLDLQDEHNKRRSKALHLFTTKQMVAENGAFDDINKAREEMHKPDGIIQPNPGFKWEMHDNVEMGEAQFRILEYTDLQLSQTGPNSALAGTSGSISGIAKARDQQAGQLPISPVFDALDFWEMRMYRQAWKRARQYWRGEMFIRITDDEEKVQFVGLNQPTTVGEHLVEKAKQDPQFQQASPEEQAGIVQTIAAHPQAQQPMKKNEIARMDMDIIIERGEDTVNVQQEEFAMLTEIAKARPEVPFSALLKMSQLRQATKKLVLDELKGNTPEAQQQAQMKQQIFELEAALKKATIEKTAAQAEQAKAAATESHIDAAVKTATFAQGPEPTAKESVAVN